MRLLTWNIRQGGGSRLPRIADALKRHDADIVVLSEYRGARFTRAPEASRHVLVENATNYVRNALSSPTARPWSRRLIRR
jgi:hypothetical protein